MPNILNQKITRDDSNILTELLLAFILPTQFYDSFFKTIYKFFEENYLKIRFYLLSFLISTHGPSILPISSVTFFFFHSKNADREKPQQLELWPITAVNPSNSICF